MIKDLAHNNGGYVSVAYVRSLFDYLRDQALDPARIFGASRTARIEREDSFGRLPVMEWVQLFEQAEAKTGDRQLALHVGEHIKPRHYGLLGYVTMSCATLREAIDRLLRYESLVGELSHSQLRVAGETAELHWQSPLRPVPPRVLAETSLVAWVTYGRWLMGDAYAVDHVCFQHPAPRDIGEYHRLFGPNIRFSASRTALGFPAIHLTRPLVQANLELQTLLDAQAQARLRELQALEPFHRRVRERIRRQLLNGPVSLNAVAAELAMSERSLERHLRQTDRTFRQVLDEARLEYAKELLANPWASLSEIAIVLGYSEQSAFSRAFRRWTGESPARFRGRLMGAL